MSDASDNDGTNGSGPVNAEVVAAKINVPTSNNAPAQYPQLEDKGDFAIVKWLAGFEPHNLPDSLSNAFRLGPLQDKLKITKPIVWLANLSCDFKSAYSTIDDPHDVFGPTLGGRRRSSDGKRTYPRTFTASEKKRFELLQDEYHNQRWQNLLLLGYDPATAATMVGALRDKHMRVFSPPPLFTLSPRMIVTDEEKRMKMKATMMGYLDGLAKQAEKELLEDLDREIAETQQSGNGNNNNNNKSKNAKKKAKKKAATAAKKKSEISSTSFGDSSFSTQQQQSPSPSLSKSITPPLATTKTETVEEKRRRIEFAVAEARRQQNEAEQLKLQQQQKEKEEQQKTNNMAEKNKNEEDEVEELSSNKARPSSPGPLSPDQMKYLREQQQKQKPHMLENYDEKDRQIIRDALERTGLNEEDVTKDVTAATEKDGKGMPYAWCCDFCKTATFPTFAEAALHETTCSERPKTEEEMEEVNKGRYKVGDNDADFAIRPAKKKTDGEGGSEIPQGEPKTSDNSVGSDDNVKGGELPKTTTRQRGSSYAAKKLASDSKEVNINEMMDSLALEWSEKKVEVKESKANSEKKEEVDVKPATPVIPSVDYSDDESDSDDDLNLEQFVRSAVSKTPAKKAPVAPVAVRPKVVEMPSTPPPEKVVKQTQSEKDAAKALIKKEKKKAAAAAKKEKKKAEKAAAAAAAAAAASNQNVQKDNIPTTKSKKIAPSVVAEKAVPTKESGPSQINQNRPPPGLVSKSPVSMEIAQAMKSSTIDYVDRVNDTALPQAPIGSKSPNLSLEQSSDLFIMQDSPSPSPRAPAPQSVQSQIMSNSSPMRSASTSQPISPSIVARISSLTADNEVLTAKANFLESENQSLRAEIEALRNQITADRQSAVEALQRVQLKSYISDTAKDAAEERAAWLEAVLVDAVTELTTREVVRIETNEAIKTVSYAAVQAPAPSPSYHHVQQMPPQRTSVLPPIDDGDQQRNSNLSSLRSTTNGLDSFSFEGDLSLGQFSSQNSSGILPQAPWPRDEGVFARLRRGDDA